MVIFHGNSSPQTLQIHNDFWSFVREFYIVVSCLCAFFSSALLPPQSLRNIPCFILVCFFYFIHALSSFCTCYTTRTYRLFVCCVFPISILDVHYQFTMSSVFFNVETFFTAPSHNRANLIYWTKYLMCSFYSCVCSFHNVFFFLIFSTILFLFFPRLFNNFINVYCSSSFTHVKCVEYKMHWMPNCNNNLVLCVNVLYAMLLDAHFRSRLAEGKTYASWLRLNCWQMQFSRTSPRELLRCAQIE